MKLHYRAYGRGHPLIILHGLFGTLDNWHSMSRRLGERYAVFALDQRNHGYSPHSDEFSYSLMAGDLLEFVDEQGLKTAHVLGHSMGGKTAMNFALTHPDRVDALIIVDIAPRAYGRQHDQILDALHSVDLRTMTSRQEVDDALKPRMPQLATRQFLLKNLARGESNGFRWKFNLATINSHYTEVTKAISGKEPFRKPTLFIKGAKSPYIQLTDEGNLRTLFPDTRVITIQGAGHWVHADAPDEFTHAVLDFLETA